MGRKLYLSLGKNCLQMTRSKEDQAVSEMKLIKKCQQLKKQPINKNSKTVLSLKSLQWSVAAATTRKTKNKMFIKKWKTIKLIENNWLTCWEMKIIHILTKWIESDGVTRLMTWKASILFRVLTPVVISIFSFCCCKTSEEERIVKL